MLFCVCCCLCLCDLCVMFCLFVLCVRLFIVVIVRYPFVASEIFAHEVCLSLVHTPNNATTNAITTPSRTHATNAPHKTKHRFRPYWTRCSTTLSCWIFCSVFSIEHRPFRQTTRPIFAKWSWFSYSENMNRFCCFRVVFCYAGWF